ncbi:MAG: hypothetical protein ACTSU3_07500 [Candidatus Thorarchaeota archaeon]
MAIRNLKLFVHLDSKQPRWKCIQDGKYSLSIEKSDSSLNDYPYELFPFGWIGKSEVVMNWILEQLSEVQKVQDSNLLVADFAAGQNEEIPLFFTQFFPAMLDEWIKTNPSHEGFTSDPLPLATYCLDFHELRISYLFGLLEEENALDMNRVVFTKLESMDKHAVFPDFQKEVLPKRNETSFGIDQSILEKEQIPSECFNLGILNTDMIGYLFEYYKLQSDLVQCLSGIHKTMVPGGLLIVTQPCLFCYVDNIGVLEDAGFEFIESVDVDLKSGEVITLKKDVDQSALSRMDHYSFLVFVAK